MTIQRNILGQETLPVFCHFACIFHNNKLVHFVRLVYKLNGLSAFRQEVRENFMFKKLISIFSPKMFYNLNSTLNQLFVTVLLIISIKSIKSMENLERLVIEHLLDGYNKDARPFVSEPPGGPVVVKVGIHLRQITELVS